MFGVGLHFSPRGPHVGPPDRAPGRDRADRRGDGSRGARLAFLGLELGFGSGLRALPLGREHGRAAQGARSAPAFSTLPTAGSPSGGSSSRTSITVLVLVLLPALATTLGAGDAAGAAEAGRRRRKSRGRHRTDPGQGRSISRRHARRRAARRSVASRAGRAHGLPRALHPRRPGPGARDRVRGRRSVRRLLRAGRLLRRGRDRRVRPHPQGRRPTPCLSRTRSPCSFSSRSECSSIRRS